MINDFQKICAPGVAGLTPYQPGKPLSELEREFGISNAVKIASNESPAGVSPTVVTFLKDNLNNLNRYPDGNGFELKTALAKFYQIGLEQITLGNGSNDTLELIARAFVSSDNEVIFSQHAFAVYSLITQAIGAQAVVTKACDWGYDLDEILKAITKKTKIIFIANPNNPTGTWLTKTQLEQFLQDVPQDVLIVLDEAYYEYAIHPDMQIKDYPDGLHWLPKYPNLIITRTFSKAYGLAGLRIGYSISHPDIAEIINRIRQPFNVNTMALKAAEIVLMDVEHLEFGIKLNITGINYLVAELNKMKIRYIPSAGNFICIELGSDAPGIYQHLLREGVIVRPVDNYGLAGFLRFSIGTQQENEHAMSTLHSILDRIK